MIVTLLTATFFSLLLSYFTYRAGYKSGYNNAKEQANKELKEIEAKYVKLTDNIKFSYPWVHKGVKGKKRRAG